MRTIAIGLDAFEWWYAEQLLEEGKLPHLAALRSRGTSCRLANHVPYRSELSWTRYLTGVEPLDTRTWPACVVFDPSDYSARTRTAAAASPFYADVDGPVIAFDLIHSTLADGVGGDQVTAWGAHSPQYPRASAPAGLLREIDGRFGPSPSFGNDVEFAWYDTTYIANLEQALCDAARTRADALRWLMERRPDWQLALTAMSEIHGGGHVFWHGVDPAHPAHRHASASRAKAAMDAVCVASDAALGRMLEGLDDVNVVVFALHGMLPADDVTAAVLLPDLLYRRATGRSLLRGTPDVTRWRAAGCPPTVPAPGETWAAWMRAHFVDGPTHALRGSLGRRAPALLRGLRRLAGRAEPPIGELTYVPSPEQAVDSSSLSAFEEEVDYQVASWYRRHWPQMRAFALPTFADGHVRINLAGREAHGIVPASEYEREVRSVIELLEACRNVRTGAPAVDDIIWLRREDPFAVDGPAGELLVVWRDGPDALEHPDPGVVGPIPAMRTGSHRPNGLAVLAGPGVPVADLGVRPVDDLTSTVVALAGGDPTRVKLGSPLVAVPVA